MIFHTELFTDITDYQYHIEVIEKVLKLEKKLYLNEYLELCNSWLAFTREPEKYKNTVVVDMVNSWLQEKREGAKI